MFTSALSKLWRGLNNANKNSRKSSQEVLLVLFVQESSQILFLGCWLLVASLIKEMETITVDKPRECKWIQESDLISHYVTICQFLALPGR